MKRREFIGLLGWATAWASGVRAQESRRVIGVLCSYGSSKLFAEVVMPAASKGLKDAGFVEGKNISIEMRDADGHYDRLPSFAAELVGRDVAAIFAADLPSRSLLRKRPKPFQLSSQSAPIRSRWASSIVSVGPRITLRVSVFFSVSSDQGAWSCCMNFSLPPTQSHCSQIPPI